MVWIKDKRGGRGRQKRVERGDDEKTLKINRIDSGVDIRKF